MVRPGEQAPDFRIEAAVSGRVVSAPMGRPLVLVFHGPKTADAPKQVGKAVRAEYPSAEDVFVANVVDLESMAGLWSKVADAQIKQTYERMAKKVADGDPADFVVICPDYENAVAPRFGFEDSNREPGVVVLDEDGGVVGAVRGGDLARQTLELLRTV